MLDSDDESETVRLSCIVSVAVTLSDFEAVIDACCVSLFDSDCVSETDSAGEDEFETLAASEGLEELV